MCNFVITFYEKLATQCNEQREDRKVNQRINVKLFSNYRFGPHSIEVGHELIKYTDVLLGDLQDTTKRSSQFAEKLVEARNCLERAGQIFDLHYGAWHPTHQEIMQKLAKTNFLIEP